MGEVFTTSGENSENIVVPTPRLQGLFVPGIDNPLAIDGFGIVTPWGGGGTSRKYSDYGISGDISRQSTQLNDLASSLIPAEGGGISYNWEGLVGPQGIPGRDGRDGIIHIMGLNLPQNSNFLAELPHNIDQINDLGTAADKLIYTSAYTTVDRIAQVDLCSDSFAASSLNDLLVDYDDVVEVTFSSPVELTSGSKYAIVVRTSGSVELDWVEIGQHLSNVYANGLRQYSLDSGGSWTQLPTRDTYFITKAAGVAKDSNSGAVSSVASFYGTTWVAQSFIAGSTYTISSVELKLWKRGAATTGTVTVGIREIITTYSEATWAESALTSAGRAILDDATAAAQATTLGLGTGDSPTWVGATFSGITLGSVLFAGTSGVVSQDNSSLFWDNTNKRLGIGTTTPDRKLTISGSGTQNIGVTSSDESCGVIFNAATGWDCRFIYKLGGVNYWFFGCDGSDNGKFKIGTSALGTGDRFTIQSDGNIGIGTSTPDSIFHIKANVAGTVGSHPAGQLIIQDPDDTVFGNAVITGYESDGAGNPDQQLWYLGSSSSGNSNIIFLNRRNSKLQLGTNGVSQLTISGSGNFGIGESSPETLTEWTGTAPYLTLHNSTHEDTDGGGESKLIFKREDGAGTETACFQFEASHDGAVANDQLGKGIWSVNTGAGLVQALEIGSDLLATFAGSIVSANYTAVNLLTACATNAGALDFSAASKTLTVEDNAVVSQDYSSDASPQFAGIELGHASDTTLTRQAAGDVNIEGNLVYRAGGTDVPIADGGTGQSTAQLAINALTTVSGATNEHVLTKDTATGNAIFKVAAGGVSTWIALTDTDPANYTGQAGNTVVVNAGEDGLEFGAAPGGAFTSKCSVYINNTQSIVTGTWTKVLLDTEDYDTDGEFDNVTNYRFQPAANGYYHVSWGAQIGALQDTKIFYMAIYKNGTIWKTGAIEKAASNTVAMGLSCDMYLITTDYIELWVYHTGGVNKNVGSAASRYTFMDVHRFA